jgi:hypothetical protein
VPQCPTAYQISTRFSAGSDEDFVAEKKVSYLGYSKWEEKLLSTFKFNYF